MKKRWNIIKVEWSNINALDLATLTGMWLDGYSFCINDGEIKELIMTTEALA